MDTKLPRTSHGVVTGMEKGRGEAAEYGEMNDGVYGTNDHKSEDAIHPGMNTKNNTGAKGSPDESPQRG